LWAYANAYQGLRINCSTFVQELALQAFYALQKQLTSELVMAFPKAHRQYALITDTAMGTADTPGRLRAIPTQVDKDGNFYAISFPSRQLKDLLLAILARTSSSCMEHGFLQ
jgi:hypothetical protein